MKQLTELSENKLASILVDMVKLQRKQATPRTTYDDDAQNFLEDLIQKSRCAIEEFKQHAKSSHTEASRQDGTSVPIKAFQFSQPQSKKLHELPGDEESKVEQHKAKKTISSRKCYSH